MNCTQSIGGMLVRCFSEFYRYLPVATLIDDKIFVCHGGISDQTDLNTLGGLNRFSVSSDAFFTVLTLSAFISSVIITVCYEIIKSNIQNLNFEFFL
ncbi:unnamed protein product [Trichobilharzia szidati]|nr:unnamed protein product [Trichobilharzia szidati]